MVWICLWQNVSIFVRLLGNLTKNGWTARRTRIRRNTQTHYSCLYKQQELKGRHSKPRLNFKSRLLTSFCAFSSILAAAEIQGVTLRGWEIRARFPAPSSPSLPSAHNLPPPLSLPLRRPFCHRRSLHRIFMSPRATVPPSYLCNGCTTGHGSREGNVFHTRFTREKPVWRGGSSLFEDWLIEYKFTLLSI